MAVQVLTPCTEHTQHGPPSAAQQPGAPGTLPLSSALHRTQLVAGSRPVAPSENSPNCIPARPYAARSASDDATLTASGSRRGSEGEPLVADHTCFDASLMASPVADPEANSKPSSAAGKAKLECAHPCTSAAASLEMALTDWRRWLPETDAAASLPSSQIEVESATAAGGHLENEPASPCKPGTFTGGCEGQSPLSRGPADDQSPRSRGPSAHTTPSVSPIKDDSPTQLAPPQWCVSPSKAPSCARSSAKGGAQWDARSFPGNMAESSQQSSPANMGGDSGISAVPRDHCLLVVPQVCKMAAAPGDKESEDSRGEHNRHRNSILCSVLLV